MASKNVITKTALKFAGMPKEGQERAENILYGMKVMYDALKDKLPPEDGTQPDDQKTA